MRKILSIVFVFFITLQALSKSPEIKEISYSFEKQHIFVSFTLKEDFLNQEIIDAINSTNKIIFKYEIELNKKKTFWFDNTVLKSTIEKSVQFDNLAHQYEIITIVNQEIVDKKSLTSFEEVILELSKIESIDLGFIIDLSPGENIYYIRAKATLFKGFFLLLFPNDVDTGWKEKNIKTP